MNDADNTNIPAFETVPAVTPAQLHMAVTSAISAATPAGAIPTRQASLGIGPYGAMTEDTAAHMADAIAQAFNAQSPLAAETLKGLIWRGIFAFSDVVNDRRFGDFGHTSNGQMQIGEALLQAVATTPMPFGDDVPLDTIFANAKAAADAGLHGMTPLDQPSPTKQ